MISNFLDEFTGDAWKRIGCLVVVPTLIACLHYIADLAFVAETMGAVFSGQRAVEEENKLVASENKNSTIENPSFVPFDETDDNLGFAYYNERGDMDEDDGLLRQEVVEITFDFGSMEGNVRRFLSRMHRVVI